MAGFGSISVKADGEGGAKKKKRRPRAPVTILRTTVEPQTALPLERLRDARAVASIMVSNLPLWNELISIYKSVSSGAGYATEAKWKRIGYEAALAFADDQGLELKRELCRAIGSKRDAEPVELEKYAAPFIPAGVPVLLCVNVWRGNRLRFDTTNVSIKAFADGFTFAGFWNDDDAKTIPYHFIRYCGVSTTQPRCEVVIYRLK
jgi:hypothetical protein